MIENIVREPEEGKIYNAKVVKVEEFGAFVQIWPGCEGLVHISELDTNRVNKTEDIVKLGDEVLVMCTGVDKKGRLNFSRRKVLAPSEKHDKEKEEKKSKRAPKEEVVEE